MTTQARRSPSQSMIVLETVHWTVLASQDFHLRAAETQQEPGSAASSSNGMPSTDAMGIAGEQAPDTVLLPRTGGASVHFPPRPPRTGQTSPRAERPRDWPNVPIEVEADLLVQARTQEEFRQLMMGAAVQLQWSERTRRPEPAEDVAEGVVPRAQDVADSWRETITAEELDTDNDSDAGQIEPMRVDYARAARDGLLATGGNPTDARNRMAETIVVSKTGLPMKAAPTTPPQWGPTGPAIVKAPPLQPRVVKAFPVAKTSPDPPRPLTKAVMLKAPPAPPRPMDQRAALVLTQQWLMDEVRAESSPVVAAAAINLSRSTRNATEAPPAPPVPKQPVELTFGHIYQDLQSMAKAIEGAAADPRNTSSTPSTDDAPASEEPKRD